MISISGYGTYGLRSNGGKDFKVNSKWLKQYVTGDFRRNETDLMSD